jgi:hypothetical protein
MLLKNRGKERNDFYDELLPVILDSPDNTRGFPVMKAFSRRASSTDFSRNKLGQKDLSDLLFAANGVNRKDTGRRTAPSARNAQDIDIFFVP